MHLSFDMWKSIVGYEGLYEVSDDGEVRSLTRVGFRTVISYGQIIPYVCIDGHPVVQLFRYGRERKHFVCDLVAEAFIGPPNGRAIHHIDGEITNNSDCNLEYYTSNVSEALKLRALMNKDWGL